MAYPWRRITRHCVRPPVRRAILLACMSMVQIERKEPAMTRIIIVAVALVLAGTSSADAARRKGPKPEARAWQTAAVAARPYYGPAVAAGPAWAAPGECFTDDGYGRFWSCSAGPCGK
jgi:hypothetical protein